MTVDKVLSRLTGVRKSGRGWMPLCPVHNGRTPSLSIREGYEGKVLLKCFAGFSFYDIASALSLTRNRNNTGGSRAPPRPRASDWEELAVNVQLLADELWFRGQNVVRSVQGYDVSTCSPEALESLLDRIADAYEDLRRARHLDDAVYDFKCIHQFLSKRRNFL